MAENTLLAALDACEVFPAVGRVLHVGTSRIEADGPDCCVGDRCEIIDPRTQEAGLLARVAAISQGNVKLVPFGHIGEVRIGHMVRRTGHAAGTPFGDEFAGRAVNGLGQAIDGRDEPASSTMPLREVPVLDRVSPSAPLETGIRAIDGFTPIGRGQRIGIFAASGAGKTTLLEQIVRQSDVDRIVICLVGERGREVEALWREIAGSTRLPRTTLVAATSDESAPMRAQAIDQALALATYWRDAGEEVLLVVDSITRVAVALREIGLIAGEPPTIRAFTPNVFTQLPRIVEKCGAVRGGGSITAIFTVLSETDDVDDPIVEAMKSHLDGHIVLSRRLAQAGHFPAIDVCASISRVFERIADADHVQNAIAVRALMARYEEAQTLIDSGLYKPGGNRELDLAVNMHSAITAFVRQSSAEAASWQSTVGGLQKLSIARPT